MESRIPDARRVSVQVTSEAAKLHPYSGTKRMSQQEHQMLPMFIAPPLEEEPPMRSMSADVVIVSDKPGY
jgi:hypothetical protein